MVRSSGALASRFFSARATSASAMSVPAAGPRPLLLRMRCWRGVWAERKETRGAWVLRPKALSERLMVWRLGRVRRDFRRASRAGGISERRREVKMSARLAVWGNGG